MAQVDYLLLGQFSFEFLVEEALRALIQNRYLGCASFDKLRINSYDGSVSSSAFLHINRVNISFRVPVPSTLRLRSVQALVQDD